MEGQPVPYGRARITADKAGATWGATPATRLPWRFRSWPKYVHAEDSDPRRWPDGWTFVLVPEAVRAMETHCSLWVDDKHSSLNLTDTFPQLSNFRELRFEQPDAPSSSAPGALLGPARAGGGLHRPGDWLRWEPGKSERAHRD